MIFKRQWRGIAALLLLWAGLPRAGRAQGLPPLTYVAVPYDPLELVPSNAREVKDAEERAATIALLAKAKQLCNVRLHPYDLKTSFLSYGSSGSDGRWNLEDMSPGGNVYRWSAEGPSFSGVFLTVDKLLSSNRPSEAMPLRLAQVRDALWDIHEPEIGPFASLRVADGNLNGAPVRCVLVDRAYGRSRAPFSSGRSFAEAEYCVDSQTGLLETYSPYAGFYIRFDYGNKLHFREQVIPGGFTITEHGKAVIEATTQSIGEPPPRTSDVFSAAGLNPLGVGQAIVGPLLIEGFQTFPSADAAGQVVVVRGMVTPEGKVTDLEVLASTNESLNGAAVQHAMKARGPQRGSETQAGVTPESRQVIFTVAFAPRNASVAATNAARESPPAPAQPVAVPQASAPSAAPPSASQQNFATQISPQQQELDQAKKLFSALQYGEALPMFKELMSQRPGDAEVAKFASEAAIDTGDLAFARATLQPLAQANPDDWQAAALMTRVCAESGDISCRDSGMTHMRDLFSRGVTPKGMEQYPVERISVGANNLLLWLSLEPWGPFNEYARGKLTDAQGKLFLQVTLESADFDQIEFAKQHPQEAAQGIRRFSLDSYVETGENSAGQRTQTQSLYKFFHGQPAYDAMRQEFINVAAGSEKAAANR